MRLKSLELTANIAWSTATQHPVYLATGTAAHQLDATFSTVSSINVYRLDLGDRSSNMPLVGSITSEERFNQVVWGGYGMGYGDLHKAGVVVTAGDHGNLSVWDADRLISCNSGDSDQDSAIVVQKKDHVGAVNALDFNAFQPNLLASGGADSEIYIWDLEKMETPMTPGSKSQPAEDVLCLAWNKKVQHILASTFSNRCVVWDLKKNEPIIKVSDAMSRMKCKLVSWHPGIATQLCLSSEDDHTPVIQLWDLRFATSPVQSMEKHTKGVLAMSWCPRDPNLLLSCGKDNQMICWNPNAAQTGGEIVYEAQLPSQWVFDLAWCPRNPALIAASSFDGHVSLYSLMGGTSRPERTPQRVSESFGESDDPFTKVSQPPASLDTSQHMGCLRKAPSWMRRPCGANFAFGGKLITWGSSAGETEAPAGDSHQNSQGRLVHMSQVVTETKMMAQANVLDTVVQSKKLTEFCTMKADNSDENIEKEIWNFLKVSFSPNARAEYKELLGFSKDGDLVATTLRELREQQADSYNERESGDDQVNSNDPFQSVGQSGVDTSLAFSLDRDLRLDPRGEESSVETALAMALVTGRLEEAVDLCLLNGRHGEALILAVSGGAELFQRAQARVLRRIAATESAATASVARLIRAVVARDWAGVARLCGPSNWRAGLACILTYASEDEVGTLCGSIGAGLEESGDKDAALMACLCYICAGSSERLVRCWTRHVNVESSMALQALMDKVVVLRESTGGRTEPGPDVAAQMGRYATILASQGLVEVALRYLGDQKEDSLLLLRDRIYRGLSTPPADVPAPPNMFGQTTASSGTGTRMAGRPTAQKPVAPAFTGMNRPTYDYASTQPAPTPNVSHMYNPSTMYNPTGQPSPMVPPQPPRGISSSIAPPIQPPSVHTTATRPTPTTNTRPSGRPAVGGWNDPPVLKERQKPVEPGPVAPVNTFYNPAAYITEPNATPPHANAVRYHHGHGAGLPGHHVPPTQPYQGYIPNGSLTSPMQPPNFYNPSAAVTSNAPPPTMGSMPNPGTSLPSRQSHAPPSVQPQPAEPKPPLPQEHQQLEVIFGQLLSLCKAGATSRQMKMKMEDVDRKLEALYDSIRTDTVSQSVLAGVHNVVAAVRVGDYNQAIAIINHIVETANFAEIRAFVPGLKVLMQSASMMQVRVT